MRISDWSSDVCSSDQLRANGRKGPETCPHRTRIRPRDPRGHYDDPPDGARSAARRDGRGDAEGRPHLRSEEHTSELQSLMRISYAVFCLKKKNRERNNESKTHNHIATADFRRK